MPNSEIIISNAMKYGWLYNNIIKIGLPRWDIFDKYKYNFINIRKEYNEIKNNSIFIMFTWRDIKKYKNISKLYFKNIFNLINNNILSKKLELKNISLYFSLHHNMEAYKYLFKQNTFIRYIKQDLIIECLSKTKLVITDFSSIIFDIIVRYKPFILYIPDSEDIKLKSIYTQDYYDIINGLKNGTIYFENKFFSLNDTIKKIIFYIDNNFKLEKKLELFYKFFNLKGGKNTIDIINYLKNGNK